MLTLGSVLDLEEAIVVVKMVVYSRWYGFQVVFSLYFEFFFLFEFLPFFLFFFSFVFFSLLILLSLMLAQNTSIFNQKPFFIIFFLVFGYIYIDILSLNWLLLFLALPVNLLVKMKLLELFLVEWSWPSIPLGNFQPFIMVVHFSQTCLYWSFCTIFAVALIKSQSNFIKGWKLKETTLVRRDLTKSTTCIKEKI